MGGIVTSCSGFASGPKSGKAVGSTSSMPGRLTTTIVASRAIPAGSRHVGSSTTLSAPTRKKRSSPGLSCRTAASVSTL